MAEELKIVGASPPRRESRDIVTGKAKYAANIKYSGVLHGKILGSPYPHALVKKIDVSKASALPGVKAVITYKDAPSVSTHEFFWGRPICIMDKHLRYVGDYVAAVAAETTEIANEALKLVDVEYEILPAVFDTEEAMKAEAPEIFDGGNLLNTYGSADWGDIDEGFREADVIVEEDGISTPIQPHSALQPSICIAE
ncbi:MAG: hypothetical protein PHP79_11610 [Clostridia bacterium]|nr:hypothetical protein [Clostridia bacterium]